MKRSLLNLTSAVVCCVGLVGTIFQIGCGRYYNNAVAEAALTRAERASARVDEARACAEATLKTLREANTLLEGHPAPQPSQQARLLRAINQSEAFLFELKRRSLSVDAALSSPPSTESFDVQACLSEAQASLHSAWMHIRNQTSGQADADDEDYTIPASAMPEARRGALAAAEQAVQRLGAAAEAFR